MRSSASVALGIAQLAFQYSQHAIAGHSEYCLDFPLSCTNTTAVPNTCCFNYPGGELLQTQFWDTDPATGPANHWTVHGLWYHYLRDSFPSPFQHRTKNSLGLTTATARTPNTATNPANTPTSLLSSNHTTPPPSSLTWKPTGKTTPATMNPSGSTNGANTAPASLPSILPATSTIRPKKKW